MYNEALIAQMKTKLNNLQQEIKNIYFALDEVIRDTSHLR